MPFNRNMEPLGGLPNLINGYLPEPQASLMNGILLGLPVSGTGAFYEELRTVGLLHIVVLSGMNINILIAMLLNLAPFIGRRSAVFVSIITIVCFICFVGVQAPIFRAALCGSMAIVGFITGRKPLALYLLLISALIGLVLYPEWVSSLSFRLSYAATTGLILFARPTTMESDHLSTSGKILTYVKDELKTTMAAQLFTAPLIWWEFREVSLIAPVANIAVSWTIAPLMIAGLVTLIFGSLEHHLGILPAWLAYGLLTYIAEVVHLLARVPGASVRF